MDWMKDGGVTEKRRRARREREVGSRRSGRTIRDKPRKRNINGVGSWMLKSDRQIALLVGQFNSQAPRSDWTAVNEILQETDKREIMDCQVRFIR